jgi:flavodoxin
MKAMKVCILYFSQTGNTKKFAETISDSLKIQAIHDITDMEPSIVADYDTIIIGTPVHGFNPSKESMSFVESLPESSNKKVILFCTYRLWKGNTFGKLKKALKKKGYSTVLCVSAKGKEFSKEIFSDPTSKIAEVLKE